MTTPENKNEAELSTTRDVIDLPRGFRFGGLACGIKDSGKADLSLIVSDAPVVAAGVYTANQVVAAPVTWCRAVTPSARVRAVITNSGNANACTGKRGDEDTESMATCVADSVGCKSSEVLVMSTGIIGHVLPIDKITEGIKQLAGETAATDQAFQDSADAILTTDVQRKLVSTKIAIGDHVYSIAAMAKGAGMIAPNMATMLAVVLTDAPLAADDAQSMLSRVADKSFNRVSVDGHTSTNDTLLMLASGEGDGLVGDDLNQFESVVLNQCIELAKQLVADGEGAKHVLALRVSGAESDADATEIARTVAASPLVKTAITGGDPNWGRIVSAAGYAKARVDPSKISLTICGRTIYRDGAPLHFDASELSATMKASGEVDADLIVGTGEGKASFWASDLTTEYVTFNSEYTT